MRPIATLGAAGPSSAFTPRDIAGGKLGKSALIRRNSVITRAALFAKADTRRRSWIVLCVPLTEVMIGYIEPDGHHQATLGQFGVFHCQQFEWRLEAWQRGHPLRPTRHVRPTAQVERAYLRKGYVAVAE
jgi:hypothetical protein